MTPSIVPLASFSALATAVITPPPFTFVNRPVPERKTIGPPTLTPFASSVPYVVYVPWISSPFAAVSVNAPLTVIAGPPGTPPGQESKWPNSVEVHAVSPRCDMIPLPFSTFVNVHGAVQAGAVRTCWKSSWIGTITDAAVTEVTTIAALARTARATGPWLRLVPENTT